MRNRRQRTKPVRKRPRQILPSEEIERSPTSLVDRISKHIVIVVFAAGLATFGYRLFTSSSGFKALDVRVPELSKLAKKGEAAFDANCAKCHGKNAAGTNSGPPLVHDFYNPGHHGDDAFFAAAKRGVRQHHWRFGNMPALPHVTKADLTKIVRYVRELQKANGIKYRPHHM